MADREQNSSVEADSLRLDSASSGSSAERKKEDKLRLKSTK